MKLLKYLLLIMTICSCSINKSNQFVLTENGIKCWTIVDNSKYYIFNNYDRTMGRASLFSNLKDSIFYNRIKIERNKIIVHYKNKYIDEYYDTLYILSANKNHLTILDKEKERPLELTTSYQGWKYFNPLDTLNTIENSIYRDVIRRIFRYESQMIEKIKLFTDDTNSIAKNIINEIQLFRDSVTKDSSQIICNIKLEELYIWQNHIYCLCRCFYLNSNKVKLSQPVKFYEFEYKLNNNGAYIFKRFREFE